MLVLFGVFLGIPDIREFFELSPLRMLDYGILSLTAAAWALSLRWI